MQVVDSLRADAVYAFRRLGKNRMISAAAILTLGLAMGAFTATFRLFDAFFLRPLAISDPQNLYVISRPIADKSGQGWEHMRFVRLRLAMKNHADLIAASFPEQTDLIYGVDSAVEKAEVQYVSGSIFHSFGLSPAVGRLLTEDDDLERGQHPLAVLSYDYWKARFACNPKVVGDTVTFTPRYGIGDHLFEIVGVLRPGLTGTEPGTDTDIFLPATSHPLANLAVASLFRLFVRLPPGVTPEATRDRLNAALHALNQEDRKDFSFGQNEAVLLKPAGSGVSVMQERYGQALTALGLLVVLVLLIACVNVANLMSAQAAARTREMALRVSVGARRPRLMQLVLVESAVLVLGAALVGAIIAWQAAPFVVARINSPESPANLSLAGDWRVYGVGLILMLAVTVLSGFAPALRASAVRPASALRGGEAIRSARRLMRILVAVQAAFCFLVLFVSGLFAATFEHLTQQRAGFLVNGLIALDISAQRNEPPSAWAQVAERLGGTPGVEDVGESEWPLLDGNSYRFNHVSIDGRPPTEAMVRFLIISPEWINTMKIPMIKGRTFRVDEEGVAVVNREFAREYFSGENPVGKSFQAEPGGEWGHRFQIIGVVGDTRYRSIRDPILPVAYVPYLLPWHAETLMVRVAHSKAANALDIMSVLRREVSRARPGFRVTRFRTEEGLLQAQIVRERLLAQLSVFFSAVALLLAGIGFYGVLNYAVFNRQREIGIRIAVGAKAFGIIQLISTETFSAVFIGIFAGAALGIASVRYIRTLLYQVSSTDLEGIAIPVLIILLAGVLAALPAMIHAVRVDPVDVLRAD